MQRVWVQLRADGSRAHGPALRMRLLSPAHPAAAAAAAARDREASARPGVTQTPQGGSLARGSGAPSGATVPESGLVTLGAGRAPAAAEADAPSRAGARGSAELETMLGWLSLDGNGAAVEPRRGPSEGWQPAPEAAGARAGPSAHQALSGPAANARRNPAPEQLACSVLARTGAPGPASSAASAAPADQAGAQLTAPAGTRAGALAATPSDERGASVAAVLAGLELGSQGEWGQGAGEGDPCMRSEEDVDERWRVPLDNPQASPRPGHEPATLLAAARRPCKRHCRRLASHIPQLTRVQAAREPHAAPCASLHVRAVLHPLLHCLSPCDPGGGAEARAVAAASARRARRAPQRGRPAGRAACGRAQGARSRAGSPRGGRAAGAAGGRRGGRCRGVGARRVELPCPRALRSWLPVSAYYVLLSCSYVMSTCLGLLFTEMLNLQIE